MPNLAIDSERGGAIAIVHPDHSVDVYDVPENSIINIATQRGFGVATQVSNSVSLADADSQVNTQLAQKSAE